MKAWYPPLFPALLFLSLLSCKKQDAVRHYTLSTDPQRETFEKRDLSDQFKHHWYDGKAEISSFSLTQERYGELHEGHAVQVFITEDFLPEKQVKAENPTDQSYPVLKHNSTKKFLTGIYPYSIMTSSFSPLQTKSHAVKISHSTQEWCGQVYMQLNNKEQFLISSHSYFETEADEHVRLEKTWLEDELWSLLRIDPGELPSGEITAVPAFEFLRLRHKPIRSYRANASLKKRDSVSIYQLEYPSLQRELRIYFSSAFPFTIEGWEETIGDGPSAGLRTIAKSVARIRSTYWNQNSNQHRFLRDSLGLPNEPGIQTPSLEEVSVR